MAEQIYECEIKTWHMRDGNKVKEWKRAAVREAIDRGATEIRCAECHGAVRLHRQHVPHGAAPHVEHRSRQDSEYCPAGHYFKQNPGREPRLSLNPVE